MQNSSECTYYQILLRGYLYDQKRMIVQTDNSQELQKKLLLNLAFQRCNRSKKL